MIEIKCKQVKNEKLFKCIFRIDETVYFRLKEAKLAEYFFRLQRYFDFRKLNSARVKIKLENFTIPTVKV